MNLKMATTKEMEIADRKGVEKWREENRRFIEGLKRSIIKRFK